MPYVEDNGGQASPSSDGMGAVIAGINPFIGDGALSQKSLDQARQAAQGLKDSAASGGFHISENALPDLMKALDDTQTQIDQASDAIATIQQAPRLGSSDYAHQVADHARKSGTGERSASMVVQQFREVIQLTRDAVNLAARNCADNESGNVQTFKTNS